VEPSEEYKLLGLSKIPAFEQSEYNDLDWVQTYAYGVSALSGMGIGDGSTQEFSDLNQTCLENILLGIPSCKAILEIGVKKSSNTNSSTQVFLSHKPQSAIYLGVDLNDNSHFNNDTDVFTLQMDSEDHYKVENFMIDKQIPAFDIIFIDGDHSLNMVLSDWKYTRMLSDNGTVVMHDINFHAGPREVYGAVNSNYYDKSAHCVQTSDWGLGVLRKIV
jgi:hypothetical protein